MLHRLRLQLRYLLGGALQLNEGRLRPSELPVFRSVAAAVTGTTVMAVPSAGKVTTTGPLSDAMPL